MKQLLITGGVGFIGSHLVEHILNTTDFNIIILDKLDSTVNLERLSLIPNWNNHMSRVKLVWWDLKAELNKIVKNQLKNTNIVIHAAASSHVDRSVCDPLSFMQDNIIGTVNLLNWTREEKSIERIIHVSTDEVFGSAKENQSFKEEDPTHPENPYAASKAGAESIVFAFASTYCLPISIIRMTNIIGSKQHPEKFFPLVIKKILNEELIEIHSNEDKTIPGTRYYLDIQDVCSAFDILIHHKIDFIKKDNWFLGINHISGNKEYSNLYIAGLIGWKLGKQFKYELVSYSDNRPYHDLNYRINDSKFRSLYNWKPKVDLHQSLDKIIIWYLNHRSWLEI